MNINAAFQMIKKFGLANIHAMEKLGFEEQATDGKKTGPIIIGLAAYTKLNMKGYSEELDQAYDKVFNYIYESYKKGTI